jgi:hypothetical protein
MNPAERSSRTEMSRILPDRAIARVRGVFRDPGEMKA